MKNEKPKIQANGRSQIGSVREAAGVGVREALRRHMLLGESVAVADENGDVKIVGPDEIRKALEKH